MKLALLAAGAAVSVLIGAGAHASTLNVNYFEVPTTSAGGDFNICCSSPPATMPNIALGSALQGGLPVTSGGPNPVLDVSPTGQILWWSPTAGATSTGTGTLALPYTGNAMFAPNSTGSNNASFFETAILSGTLLGTGADATLTVTSDDDALVYLNGLYVGGNPGVHGAETTTLDLGNLTGTNSLQIFYADRAQDQAVLDLSLTGANTVPEPATWAMLILGLGLIGFTARRRTRAAAPVAAA